MTEMLNPVTGQGYRKITPGTEIQTANCRDMTGLRYLNLGTGTMDRTQTGNPRDRDRDIDITNQEECQSRPECRPRRGAPGSGLAQVLI